MNNDEFYENAFDCVYLLYSCMYLKCIKRFVFSEAYVVLFKTGAVFREELDKF